MTQIRLARFLARAGVTSRRGAADLVAAGRVRLNGTPPIGPGDPVDPERDRVTLDGKPLRVAALACIKLHKPPGVVTSRRATERHRTVFDLLKNAAPSLVAVGRLDVMSEGLLLLTTDGDLAARLMHPRWQVPRTYRAAVTSRLTEQGAAKLERGVRLPDEERPVRPTNWSFVPRGKDGVLELELVEGRSRVVRRVCAELGLGVKSLKRIAYGPVLLGDLARGASAPLTEREKKALYGAVELPLPE